MHVREAPAPAGEVNDCNDADLLDYRLLGWLLRRFKGRTGMTWIICPSLFLDWIAVPGLSGGGCDLSCDLM